MFVAICGIDGSGKSTIAAELVNRLRESSKKTAFEREPTLWLERLNAELEFKTDLERVALFSADRANHQQTLQDAIAKNDFVICDRYSLCTYAYNCESDLALLTHNRLDKFFLQPDLTVLLDCDVNLALERIETRGSDRYSFLEKEEKLNAVRKRYLTKISLINSEKSLVLDSSKSVDELAIAILSKLGVAN
ncbi:MAG: hypothetical protein RLZZ69_1421 [Cyanobacteriota bacterium]